MLLPTGDFKGGRCRQWSDFYTVDIEVRKAKERKVDKEITYMSSSSNSMAGVEAHFFWTETLCF